MQSKTNDLGRDKISTLLAKLAIPAIVAQLVNILYNIVDRIFIGQMAGGELAMAGVGVAFPIIILISAFSCMIGMGGAPLVAIQMGKADKDGAEKIMTNSFSLLLITAIILTVVFTVFKEPLLWAFGASQDTIGYALDYIGIYVLGTVFVQIALGMNPFINTQGFAKTGMITVIIGAITNIVLDPILIFGLNMGVRGAAIATITAQGISALWVMKFFLSKKGKLSLRKKYLKPEVKVTKNIISLGISPFIMQSTESLVLISFNTQLANFGGDLAVSAMTIMSSIMQLIVLPIQGVAQGAQPIISFNYGAKNMDRVKNTFKLFLKVSLGFSILMGVAVVTVPGIFARMFTNNGELIKVTSTFMKIYFAGIFAFGAQIACQQTFLSLGEAKISLILALLRKIILLIPLIYILPSLPIFKENQLTAVLLAEAISDLVAATVTFITFKIKSNKLLKI
ncbi:MAG: MATE family efflux transporter [Filifactoraceae bacterium]